MFWAGGPSNVSKSSVDVITQDAQDTTCFQKATGQMFAPPDRGCAGLILHRASARRYLKAIARAANTTTPLLIQNECEQIRPHRPIPVLIMPHQYAHELGRFLIEFAGFILCPLYSHGRGKSGQASLVFFVFGLSLTWSLHWEKGIGGNHALNDY